MQPGAFCVARSTNAIERRAKKLEVTRSTNAIHSRAKKLMELKSKRGPGPSSPKFGQDRGRGCYTDMKFGFEQVTPKQC